MSEERTNKEPYPWGWLVGREVGNFVGTGLGDGLDVCFVGFEEG